MTEGGLALFAMFIRVKPGPGCPMPPHLIGADVPCYVAAPNHLDAVSLAVRHLRMQGFIFQDVVNSKVDQLNPLKWTEYVDHEVAALSGEFPGQEHLIRANYPDQAQIIALTESGGTLLGPFHSWEREDDA
ncbi:hypothetical protein AYO40_00460 [Planctomycetaceae bacterium SCGC AG-212-D15]|nr:hypothetical protein AYO40_00460 [Planctomycetaceae bacterium SCGC AG-212-D15]